MKTNIVVTSPQTRFQGLSSSRPLLPALSFSRGGGGGGGDKEFKQKWTCDSVN